MMKDPTEFRDRFARWKAGEKVYEKGLPKYGGGKGNPPLIPDLKSENTNDGFVPDFEEPVNIAAGLTVGGNLGVNPTKVADNVAASRLLNRTFVEDSAAKYGTRHFGDAKISPESFYRMYRDSAGFRTRYDRGFAQEGRFYNDNMDARRMPIVKDSPGWTYNEDTGNYGGGGSSAYYTPQTNKIFIDSSNPTHEYFGGAKGVLAHELGHSVYNSATGIDFSKIRSDQPLYQYNLLSGKNKHNYRDAVNKMMSSDLRLGGDTADWSHDSNPAEGGADMTQLRYLLYKNGVFNSADSNAKIDAELLQNFYNQYKKDNPNVPYIRGIENYGIDKAAYLLNNTASLDKKFNRGNGLMLAKNGKLAILPLYGGGKSTKKGSYYLPGEKIRRELDVPYDNSSYDYRRANQLGYEPDETGHMPSRDWITGRYLKTPTHPTESLAIYKDLGLGYDVFDKYGNTYSQPNWGSTWLSRLPGYSGGKGFSGLLPINIPGVLRRVYNSVKERAYRTITPLDYNIPKAAKEFVSGKNRNKQDISPVRNEEWARYLGVPYEGESNFEPSPYRPQKGKTYDTVLRFKDESKILSDDALNQMLDRQRKTGKNSWLVTGNGGGLGTYTLSLGEDEKGKYISYYDDWDINPFKGISAKLNIPILSKIEDVVPGSNPYTVYGRRYYLKK